MSFELPTGWVQERTSEMSSHPQDAGTTVLVHPAGGFVTICCLVRGFALGRTRPRPTKSGVYAGRMWRAQLWDDAVAALSEIYKDEK